MKTRKKIYLTQNKAVGLKSWRIEVSSFFFSPEKTNFFFFWRKTPLFSRKKYSFYPRKGSHIVKQWVLDHKTSARLHKVRAHSCESALRFHESALSFRESALRFHESALRFHESALSFRESALRFCENTLSLRKVAFRFCGIAKKFRASKPTLLILDRIRVNSYVNFEKGQLATSLLLFSLFYIVFAPIHAR